MSPLRTSSLLLLPLAQAYTCVNAPQTLARGNLLMSAAVADAEWLQANGIAAPKLEIRAPEALDRGKGGVFATESVAPMEVLATIPRALLLSPAKGVGDGWAAELTAAALMSLHGNEETSGEFLVLDGDALAKKRWIESWADGGWATANSDLGRPGVRWGADDVTGCLMATGSDNDKNIYAKFRFPCHPVVHRASVGLAALTRADKTAAVQALNCRGRAFRGMRDELISLVETPTARPKGSVRDKRSWDVADALSRVLSRVTTLQLDDDDGASPSCVVVPLHERLAHCTDPRGENSKLLVDPRESGSGGADVLLVASRAIDAGEEITRDYLAAPRLDADESDGPLRLLLQFGLPPRMWGAEWVDELLGDIDDIGE